MIILLWLSALQENADEKKAREWLGKIEQRYATAKSLSYSATITEERSGGAGEGITADVLLRNRDRLRLELRYTSMGEEARDVVAGRDKCVVEYHSQINEHREWTIDGGVAAFPLRDPAGACYLGGKLAVNLPLDAKDNRVAWKLEEADNAVLITVEIQGAIQGNGVVSSLKIDPAAHSILSWNLEERGAENLIVRRRVAYASVKFDAEISDERFAFAPPADSRKVEAFSDPSAVRLQKFVGKELPDIELTALDGAKVKLVDRLRGSVTIVCLWRSYHPDCTLSIHHFNVLHEKFGARGLKIMLVSDESSDALAAYLRAPDQPDWDDAFFSAASALGEPYTLSRHSPTTFLVDGKGVLRKVFLGVAKETARYEPDVEALLEERTP